MDWKFWTGTAILTATVGALVWLCNRPAVRRLPATAARTRVVLVQLLRDQLTGRRRSASALRRRVGMTVTDFYELMERLTRDRLVVVVQVRAVEGVRVDVVRLDGYQLTAEGVDEARRALVA